MSGVRSMASESEAELRTEYRATCGVHSSEWTPVKSLATEWRDVHNGAPDPVHGNREPCSEGRRAAVEEREVEVSDGD